VDMEATLDNSKAADTADLKNGKDISFFIE
jgi:hypothetical protein